MEHINSMVEGGYSPKEVAKFVLVLTVITLLSWTINNFYGPKTLISFLELFMGIFFLVFGVFKLIGYKMFVNMFAGYDVLAKRFRFYAYAYPFIELGLATLYLFNLLPEFRDWLSLLIMGIGTIGVAQEIKRRSGVHCACLGNVIKLPLSTVSLVEDAGMGLMALLLIVFGN